MSRRTVTAYECCHCGHVTLAPPAKPGEQPTLPKGWFAFVGSEMKEVEYFCSTRCQYIRVRELVTTSEGMEAVQC